MNPADPPASKHDRLQKVEDLKLAVYAEHSFFQQPRNQVHNCIKGTRNGKKYILPGRRGETGLTYE